VNERRQNLAQDLAAAALLNKLGGLAETARGLACPLYSNLELVLAGYAVQGALFSRAMPRLDPLSRRRGCSLFVVASFS
jgi:hypothetical protein